MPAITFNCPQCTATLKFANPIAAGKKIKCPKCGSIFPMPAPDAGLRSGPPPARPVPVVQAVVVEATPVHADVDDEPEEEFVARSRRKKRKKSKSSAGLVIGLVVGGVALLLVAGIGVAAIVWFARSATSAAGKDWKEFTSPEGRFRVLLPGTPTQESRQVPTPMGVAPGQEFKLELQPQQLQFELGYTDFPAVIVQAPRAQLFDGGRTGFLTTTQAQLVREQDITLDGHPGREVEFTVPSKRSTGFFRMYLVNTRLYVLLIAGARVQRSSPEVQQFFDSFKITAAGPAPREQGPQQEPPPVGPVNPPPGPANPPRGPRGPMPGPRGPLGPRNPAPGRPPVTPPAAQYGPEQTVTLHITGIRDDDTRQLILDKLPTLTDGGGHQLRSQGGGDRVVVTLAPVRDPQAFADKIDFGTVTRIDGRDIHVAAKKLDVPGPNADPVTRALFELKSSNVHTRNRALDRLAQEQPTERKAEVAKVLETILSDSDQWTRCKAAKALGVWGTPESVPALLKQLEDKDSFPRKEAIEALAKLKDDRAIEPLAERLKDFFDRGPAKKALEEWGGSAVEKAVLKQIDHADHGVRSTVCDLLKVIGTKESLPALERVVKAKDFFVTSHAEDAIRAIQARNRK